MAKVAKTGLSWILSGVCWLLVAGALGCSGKAVHSDAGNVGQHPPSFVEAISEESIPGETFHQVWGTDSEVWILGGLVAPPVSEQSPPRGPAQDCSDDRYAASSIVRRRTTSAFELVEHPATMSLTSLRGSGPSDVWMVGLGGGVYQFDGQAWRVHDIRSAEGLAFEEVLCWEISLSAVFPLSPQDVWVVGYIYPATADTGPGLILHYDGQTWKRHPVGAPDGFFAVWAAGVDDAWAVGSSGLAYHYDGASWQRVDAATDHYLHSVRGSAADDVWAVGNTAVSTHFDGDRWQLIEPSQDDAGSRALAGNAGGGLWRLTTTGRDLARDLWRQSLMRLDGQSWQEEAHTTDQQQALQDLSMTPDGQLWGVGSKIVQFR